MRQVLESIKPQSDIIVNIRSFARSLRAENVSPRTQETYLEAVTQFTDFLEKRGMSTDVASIHRGQVEEFIEDLLHRFKPATANNRYRGLQRFFKWLIKEGEIKESPMARMKPPRVPEDPTPVLPEDDLRRLLATCEKGKNLQERRGLRPPHDVHRHRSPAGGDRWPAVHAG